MECNFQAGDAVVCIFDYEVIPESAWLKRMGILMPQLDERYHINTVELCDCGGSHILVTLKGIVQPQGIKAKFFHTSFRKLLTIDDFKSDEANAPSTRILEPADGVF